MSAPIFLSDQVCFNAILQYTHLLWIGLGSQVLKAAYVCQNRNNDHPRLWENKDLSCSIDNDLSDWLQYCRTWGQSIKMKEQKYMLFIYQF